ncbi:MAG: hypothetical protein R3251_00595 [Candidatus Spechtbacterales bacterium]|nr:hypothetical protein [Candidatus Spechtbacterales bacterium]
MNKLLNNWDIKRKWLFAIGLFVLFSFIFFLLSLNYADASTIRLSPVNGAYEVGSTFDVSILLDTEGKTVNTIWAKLQFPPDRLQVVSPTTGRSIISIWTTPPNYDNANGTIELQGLVTPNGINTSQGLVTTITFRTKRPGNAFVRFSDETTVLLHDGHGTEDLRQAQDGVYELILPPPAGPVVASETHPDQTKWYTTNSVSLRWASEDEIEAYSYVLDQQPLTTPDDISEGLKNSVTYSDLADGTHYFHIKALRDDSWGGVTHFAVNIDSTPPVEFPIDIVPEAETTARRPVINFSTTDQLSGMDRYEIKLVALDLEEDVPDTLQEFFIETTSPYSPPELALGSYDVIVRAYDQAGNFYDATQRLEITTRLFKIISDEGIEIQGKILVPWWVVFLLLLIILILLGIIARNAYKHHQEIHEQAESKEMPQNVKQQLEELQEYRQRYGHMVIVLMVAASLLLSPVFSVFAQDAGEVVSTEAREEAVLAPPSITTISRDISNEEIFYAGGAVTSGDMDVLLFVQNMTTGETISRIIEPDENGKWFYRHGSFLSPGRYVIWAQSRLGEQMSPPSPQVQIEVHTTALQFGSTRLSYGALYFAIAMFLLVLNAGLGVFIVMHRKKAKQKHARLKKEVDEAEESIRRGFAILRKDIEAELDTVKKAKASKEVNKELQEKEQQLLADLDEIERKIGDEIWDVERSEHLD